MKNRNELEVQLKVELVKNIWDLIFSTGVLGLFKKGSKDTLIDSIQFDEDEFIGINSCEEYDEWHTHQVGYYHQKLIPLYKENQKIDPQNPYTYTARIFNQFLKLYLLQIVEADPFTYGKFFEYAHPIFSNKFLKALAIDMKSLTEFNKELYKDYVGLYRLMTKDPLANEQAYQTVALIEGIHI
ncbi:MAG: hypothetical protein ABJK11_07980 [Balneola sp.]